MKHFPIALLQFQCCVPDLKYLREFVSRPPICSTRLHCTMIRHDDDANQSSGTCYTLYLEFLGGLVPLLKGKRTSKIRPEFVIFDPQIDGNYFSLHAKPHFGRCYLIFDYRSFLLHHLLIRFYDYDFEKFVGVKSFYKRNQRQVRCQLRKRCRWWLP